MLFKSNGAGMLLFASRARSFRAARAAVAPLAGGRRGGEDRGQFSSRAHAGGALAVAVGLSAGIEAARCEAPDWEARQGEHAWLEEVQGADALRWAKEQNERTAASLGEPSASPTYDSVLAVLQSTAKIPAVRRMGDSYYNFWTDASNPRGLWRRTSPSSYRSAAPEWETVLDIDALGKAEGVSWVYKGHALLREFDASGAPLAQPPTRTLLSLSPGGSDAIVRREFDLVSKQFVTDQPFRLDDPSKSRASWLDKDTLLVGVDLAPGDVTDSGYPRTVREWKRGSLLADAPVVFEGAASDVSVGAYVSRSRGTALEWRYRSTSFYTSKRELRAHTSSRDGVWYKLDLLGLQDDASISHFGSTLLIELRSAWTLGETTHPSGTLLSVELEDFLAKATSAAFEVVFAPTATASLQSFTATKSVLVLSVLDNVKSRLTFLRRCDLAWLDVGSEEVGQIRGCSVSPLDADESDEYWLSTSSYTQPSRLSLALATDGAAGVASCDPIKALPPLFDAEGIEAFQEFATSKDGTRVPYFCVRRKDAGPSPTLLYGYGGFEISLTPGYGAVTGAGWLERGGTYVVANIRGGGEFGPSWHQAALKANRQAAYDDFAAVAERLIETGVAAPRQIGIRGGSNGGLLVGNMYVQRPELFGAVVCAVPLLDMKRYTHLLAGASWSAEYGDPDSADWAFLKKYSPYHQIDPARKYPPLLMTTSTKDDRVHPYHARSFVRRLQEHGVADVFYYENMEGGHGGAADAKQSAYVTALYLDFLFNTLSAGSNP